MADLDTAALPRGWGTFEPLREKVFRRIWTGSLLSNFGQLILGVGAAWEMVKLTDAPDKVALVQTALFLPLMLVAVPAGAMADMFDRRKVVLAGLVFSTLSSMLLTALAFAGMLTPWVLLSSCFLIGTGVALYAPAWQASVREQVSRDHLPAAVALGSISYNVARSFGPAIGGLIVLVAGAMAAFAVNVFCYIPLLAAFFFWRRPLLPSRLPPERMDRAIVSGARYLFHSPPIRTVVVRSLTYGLAGAAINALAPLVARDLLHGDAGIYGLLLGAYGVGAVGGAMLTGLVRERLSGEAAVSACVAIAGAMVIVIGLSRHLALTTMAMGVAGAVWMLMLSLMNVGVQLSAPRWVTARALAWYQSALTGGSAIGAWCWGQVAEDLGLASALVGSGMALLVTLAIGFVLPMPRVSGEDVEPVDIGREPEVALALTNRSGPIIIEIDYRVDPAQARQFYDAMLKLQRARKRNGGFNWSLARDIADPWVWTERYHCPTWGDYLHQRDRFTQADRDLQAAAESFLVEGYRAKVRRRLERPFGSVRWRAETPDPANEPLGIYTP